MVMESSEAHYGKALSLFRGPWITHFEHFAVVHIHPLVSETSNLSLKMKSNTAQLGGGLMVPKVSLNQQRRVQFREKIVI